MNSREKFQAVRAQRAKERKRAYLIYMDGPVWARKRSQTLDRDGHKCRTCGAVWNLHVHHVTYDRLGHEDADDMITLCSLCHDAVHAVGGCHNYIINRLPRGDA